MGRQAAGCKPYNRLGDWPVGAAYLKATLSNNTSFVAEVKYSFGSWGNPAPLVSKAPPPPQPSGIPLSLFAGYEWIQLATPSDKHDFVPR